jgi:hypothetical protein
LEGKNLNNNRLVDLQRFYNEKHYYTANANILF